MATVTRNVPVPPPTTYSVELSQDEAQALASILRNVAVKGLGETTFDIYKALVDAGINASPARAEIGITGLAYFTRR